jgi:CheY-like chemotaxis protein
VHGIAGGTILGNGHVVLVLEMNDLLAVRARTTGRIAPVIKRETSAQPALQMRQRVEPVPQLNTSSMPTVGSKPTTPQRGKHVLVVDDSPSVRRVVSNMLKQHQWEVQTARDGVEALEMVAQETPAAILLDIEMPRMDGYELISTIRAQEQYKTLPLIVLTSRAASKHQQRAMQLGASSYVVKPYQDEELLNTLNSLVYGMGNR